MNGTLAITALTMGLVGSLHCAGMCGPIMLILPFQQLKGWQKAAGLALYHFSRISVYVLMGVAMHTFRHLFHPEWQQTVSLVLGSLLLAFGLYSFLAQNKTIRIPWTGWVQRQASRFMGKPSLPALMAAGALNGLLPCGLVYMALSLAATAPSTTDAAMALYFFGAGTLPMLLSITLLQKRIGIAFSGMVKRFVPVMLLFFGVLFILRGANLGIPYLSPKVEIAGSEVKSNCCHKE